jgi:hypothetical protein
MSRDGVQNGWSKRFVGRHENPRHGREPIGERANAGDDLDADVVLLQ